jgi:hypothetical protein
MKLIGYCNRVAMSLVAVTVRITTAGSGAIDEGPWPARPSVPRNAAACATRRIPDGQIVIGLCRCAT